jgi:UDP-N-acetyl-D-mannosaminuronic acid dehydrogenase
MSEYKVCIVGVGFVGLTLALSLTKRGQHVIAIEKDLSVVNELRNGYVRFDEPDLISHLSQAKARGLFEVFSPEENMEILQECDVFILTVGTPLSLGVVNLEFLENAIRIISPYVSLDDLVIVRSTVKIGITETLVKRILDETTSGYFLAMCPERTVEGFALKEMGSLPQIIGGIDPISSEVAARFFKVFDSEIVQVQDSQTAEMIKLVNNTYRDLMFGFANEIAGICNEFGINPREVIQAANHNYSRSNIAFPGLTGGPCLEKDPWILADSAGSRNFVASITMASRHINEAVISSYFEKTLGGITGSFKKIAVLGLSFKGRPSIRDARGGFALPLLAILDQRRTPYTATGYEPAGKVLIEHTNLRIAESLAEAALDADLIVILTNALEFHTSGAQINESADSKAIIVDYWGVLDREKLGPNQVYFSFPGEKPNLRIS